MAAATEQAATQLRRLILDGTLEPGARLQEVELAAQLAKLLRMLGREITDDRPAQRAGSRPAADKNTGRLSPKRLC